MSGMIDQFGVNPSERELLEILNNSCLSTWTYANPWVVKSNKKHRELSDAIVVFRNDIIIFSDKAPQRKPDQDISLNWSRWSREFLEPV